MEPVAVISFAAVLFVVSLTPGPAAAYCLAVGIEEHGRSALWAPAGVTLGKLVHLGVAAVGAVSLADVAAPIRRGILLAAVFYLLWEGFRHWTHRTERSRQIGQRSGPHAFHIVTDGFLVSVANPESLASSLAIVPLFAVAGMTGPDWVLLVGAGGVAVMAAYTLYEAIAHFISHRLAATTLNRVVGATYVAAATGLAIVATI